MYALSVYGLIVRKLWVFVIGGRGNNKSQISYKTSDFRQNTRTNGFTHLCARRLFACVCFEVILEEAEAEAVKSFSLLSPFGKRRS